MNNKPSRTVRVELNGNFITTYSALEAILNKVNKDAVRMDSLIAMSRIVRRFSLVVQAETDLRDIYEESTNGDWLRSPDDSRFSKTNSNDIPDATGAFVDVYIFYDMKEMLDNVENEDCASEYSGHFYCVKGNCDNRIFLAHPMYDVCLFEDLKEKCEFVETKKHLY
jgi:hypothetical protein